MYLAPDNNNRPDSTVREVQNMLNAINRQFNHGWEILVVDGIYGETSEKVVGKFHHYRGISSVTTQYKTKYGGTKEGVILGDTTVQYLRQEYQRVPRIYATPGSSIYAAPSPVLHPAAPKTQDPVKDRGLMSGLSNIADGLISCLDNFNTFVSDEIEYVGKMRLSSADLQKHLNKRFYSFTGTFDKRMTDLKATLKKLSGGTFKGMRKAKLEAKSLKGRMLADLYKYDFIGKLEREVDKVLRKHNLDKITIKNPLDTAKSGGKTIKISTKGGGNFLFSVWGAKDVIWDLMQFWQWGEDEWKEDLQKDFFEFLDALIIGMVASLVAQLIGLGLAAVISGGWLVAVVAIIAVILGAIITFFIDYFKDDDRPFSQIAFENFVGLTASLKF